MGSETAPPPGGSKGVVAGGFIEPDLATPKTDKPLPVKRRTATTPTVETPGAIVKWGWRDEPITGVDQCVPCQGWGTLSHVLKPTDVKVHRTCPDCNGKGYK